MPRFFVPKEAFFEGGVKIEGQDARHIARSLRMAAGDEIWVCDNEGNEYLATLTRIRDEECECEIKEKRCGTSEPPVDITLFMAYPKSDKLETVIQKAVELGASRIVPFESSRCIKRPKAEKAEKQNARLMRIAEEAAKQCGRAKLPSVSEPLSFGAALSEAKNSELALFCYEGEGTVSLKKVLTENSAVKSISVTVGSEGGFSPEESEKAKEAGLIPVNLGPRILRCETAPAYALSAISYFFEL
jgi:16S rRNA (uracil1498-N3)-methyltransferase